MSYIKLLKHSKRSTINCLYIHTNVEKVKSWIDGNDTYQIEASSYFWWQYWVRGALVVTWNIYFFGEKYMEQILQMVVNF